jgi:coiled-coil domain-containing protein 55
MNRAKGISAMNKVYADYLSSNEAAHAAAISATSASSTSITPKPIQGPSLPKDLSDLELAAKASKELGIEVEVNDDGQIVDHSEILRGGLNISGGKKGSTSTATSNGGFAVPISHRKLPTSLTKGGADTISFAEGPGEMDAASRGKISRARLSKMAEEQYLELQEKKRKAEDQELNEAAVKFPKRNDESRIEQLKREAMERREKKKKEMEAQNQSTEA